MKTTIEDFRTGWYGITIGLKKSEINPLIQNLARLRDESSDHFHGRSSCDGPGGIADIEFHLVEEDSANDMIFDFSTPIY